MSKFILGCQRQSGGSVPLESGTRPSFAIMTCAELSPSVYPATRHRPGWATRLYVVASTSIHHLHLIIGCVAHPIAHSPCERARRAPPYHLLHPRARNVHVEARAHRLARPPVRVNCFGPLNNPRRKSRGRRSSAPSAIYQSQFSRVDNSSSISRYNEDVPHVFGAPRPDRTVRLRPC